MVYSAKRGYAANTQGEKTMADNENKCPRHETNNADCTCPNTDCANHGVCCACVARHLGMKNHPQCFKVAGI